MTRHAVKFGIALLLAGFFVVTADSARAAEPVTYNDTARFLAGMKPAADSPLTRLTREAAWSRHARTLDQAWKRIEKRQLSKIRAWSKKHLKTSQDLMLYMFSGPDFLYADAFFPNAKTYVLSALEPVGPIPSVTSMSAGMRSGELQQLRGSMQTVLSYSFFITKQMKAELRDGRLKGTLPLLYVFLARAGKTIDTVELVSLNPDGNVVPRGNQTAKGASAGVRIGFKGADGVNKTLYYFRTDLGNGGLQKSGLRTFLTGLGPADSLVKSASYLLHGGWFSEARNFLLKQSAAIVQDDSGIPVRYFSSSDWTLHPFGRYAGPINLFAKRYQREMARLFSKGRAQKIDFGIGYKWRTHETNVLLALKKNTASAPGGN